MVKLQEVVSYLDGLFEGYRSLREYSNNGLQIEAGEECRKVAFAVDVCRSSLVMASEAGAELLVAHHGLSWGNGFERLVGMDARRFGFAFRRHISVYAMHLPLDAHPALGNNVILAQKLGLKHLQPFFEVRGLPVGMRGELPEEQSLDAFSARLKELCGQAGMFRNREKVLRVGVVSGAGGDAVAAAAQAGLDCLVTGEAHHQDFHAAEELGVSVLLGGHYATETFGVRAVMERMTTDFPQVETVFLDCPTGC